MSNLPTCAREGCEERFVPNTHNQKYHSAQCTKLATNMRLMEKYYNKRAQRLGKTRICSNCRVEKLSRYNDTVICGGCALRNKENAKSEVMNMLLAISWEI